jgi:CheY-like chemotaxis protein
MVKELLIIDDDDRLLDVLTEFFQLKGFHTLTAQNGDTGLAMAEQHRPDCVLCDINIPGMDGLGVLGALKGSPATRDMLVVVISGHEDRQSYDRAQALGADAYYVKPFDIPSLVTTISRLLDAKGVK